MKLSGIKWHVIWLTWFLRSFTINTIISILLSGATFISISGSNATNGNMTVTYANAQYFSNTNYGIVLMTFIVYSLQVSMFTILISQIFSTRKKII